MIINSAKKSGREDLVGQGGKLPIDHRFRIRAPAAARTLLEADAVAVFAIYAKFSSRSNSAASSSLVTPRLLRLSRQLQSPPPSDYPDVLKTSSGPPTPHCFYDFIVLVRFHTVAVVASWSMLKATEPLHDKQAMKYASGTALWYYPDRE